MNEKNKNILFVLVIAIITISALYLLPLIPNYLRPPETDDIAGLKFIIVFLIANIILIGIPAGFHYLYARDYSKIKNIWFFAIFGGVVGAFIGEIAMGASWIMILPYTILMLIYAAFYKRFVWWKVALTSYLAGIIIENGLNRSPIQVPTLIWIAFFIYPYFVTKIWENRKKISILSVLKDFKWAVVFSIIFIGLTIYSGSPPLLFIAITFPFAVSVICKLLNKKKRKEISMMDTIKNLKWEIIFSAILIILAVYISRDNISPPLIIFGALLPFIIRGIYKLIKIIRKKFIKNRA